MTLNLLIKPASGLCDLRCRYCFYRDEMSCRETSSYGLMSPETQDVLLRRVFETEADEVVLAYQGGEPTLAGLDYFERAADLEKQYNTRKLPIRHALQTNGLSLDKAWAGFLRREGYLVGLSLDGPRGIHDAHRLDAAGNETFARARNAARLLEQQGVEFNILSVVTAAMARKADSTYDFLRKQGFRYLQFIPCLDPLTDAPGAWSLSGKAYGQFLRTVFDRWFREVSRGERVSVRLFDDLAGMMLGHPPGSCGVSGRCVNQQVVEADGSVYPCDFYALDEYRLGDLREMSFHDLEAEYRRRVQPLLPARSPDCAGCRWLGLCGGGCARERVDGKYRFCADYAAFLDYAFDRLRWVGRRFG